MRVAIVVLGLAGCSGPGGGTTPEGPPITMSLDCEEAVRDAVPAGADLAAIVAATPVGGTVLVGPGTFRGPLEIRATGVTLRGTCPAVTFIEGSAPAAAIQVLAGGAAIERLTVRGGAPAIDVSGLGFSATLRDVVIERAEDQALRVSGLATMTGERVTLRDTAGRALVVASGASAELATATITDSAGLGVFVDGASLILRNVTVSATAPDATAPGRGIHAQRGARVEVFDSVVEGNADAGIAAIDSDLFVHGTRVSGTTAGSAGTGDGIGFFLGPDGVGGRTLETSDVALDGNARAALIADGDVGEVAIFGGTMTGGAYATVTQNEAELTVDGTAIEPGLPTLEGLVGPDALPIEDDPVD